MQYVSFFGIPLLAITKGQSSLWLALMGLFFSSILCAQRVDVIDQKGTKASTGVEFTESATAPSNNLEGDLWLDISSSVSELKVYSINAVGAQSWIPLSSVLELNDLNDVNTVPSTNDVLVYNGTEWVAGTPSRKKARYVNNNGRPDTNPLIIGLSSSTFNGSGKYDYINIDEFDIIIMGNSSSNNYVQLEDLNANYDGKVITIVEYINQNPGIIMNGFVYDGAATGAPGENPALFDGPYDDTYEAIDFVWLWDANLVSGDWYAMR